MSYLKIKGCKGRSSGARRRAGGFTLVEVVLALMIISVVAVVLLGQRVEVIEDTSRICDQRIGWTLAIWKMGEIELDKRILGGIGETNSGDFQDLSDEYGMYRWEYEAQRVLVATNDPEKRGELPKEIMHVKLRILREAGGEKADLLTELEGQFGIPRQEPVAPGASPGKDE